MIRIISGTGRSRNGMERSGEAVLVDDGTYPKGQIKKVSAATISEKHGSRGRAAACRARAGDVRLVAPRCGSIA